MFRIVVLILLAGLAVPSLRGQPISGYYDFAAGKSGPALRSALHAIVHGHVPLPYASSTKIDSSDGLKLADEVLGDTNRVVLIYSDRTELKSTFGLTTGWNREHLWCDSYGLDGKLPGYSDLHNLRPADANVNSARGNKFYDVSDPASPGYRKPAHADAPNCSTDSDSWEPPDTVKGEIARSLFYMAVRYVGDTNEPTLHLTDRVSLIASTNSAMGRLTTLLKWSAAFPPTKTESNRNNTVDTRFQHNRNPFVDVPRWAGDAFLPVLTLARQASSVRLTWSADYEGWRVQAASAASGPWTNVVLTLVLTNELWRADVPVTPGVALFRLRAP